MNWRVYRNGKDTGIVETCFIDASLYWMTRAKGTTDFYMLRPIHGEGRNAPCAE